MRLLHTFLYSALVCLASSLQCFHYRGLPDRAKDVQVAKTCESDDHFCASSLFTYSNLLHGNVLVKGCSAADSCNRTHSGQLKFIHTNETVMCCDKELCNEHLVPDLGEDPRIECYACHGHAKSCGGTGHPSLRCGKSQKSCVEISITTAFSQDVQRSMIKSCSNKSSCPGIAAFSNGESPVSYSCNHHCCTGSLCNGGNFAVDDPGAENGLECHSRSMAGGSGTVRCRGPMTRCVDLMGESGDGEPVMSGCATDAFCQGLYPPFHLSGWAKTACCGKSLCNHGDKTDTHDQEKTPVKKYQ